jgi:prepilin-type N-terminal cleavage/methylation domain-containing protein
MRKGFTLIELLVVIAIIGLLATIITGSLSSSKATGRDAKRVADIKSLQLALGLYYNDNGGYPLYLGQLVPTYIPKLPPDPTATADCSTGASPGVECYIYTPYRLEAPLGGSCSTVTNRVKYHLAAIMEQGSDKNSNLREDADWADTTTYKVCSSLGQNQRDFVGQNAGAGCVTANLTPTSPDSADNNVTPQNNSGTVEYCYDVTN